MTAKNLPLMNQKSGFFIFEAIIIEVFEKIFDAFVPQLTSLCWNLATYLIVVR